MLLVASWVGLVLLWSTLASQLVALREAITGYTGMGTLLTQALPVWGEGTLLGLTRPAPVHQPAQPALPEQPAQPPLSGAAKRLTLPSPAVRPDQLPDASELAS